MNYFVILSNSFRFPCEFFAFEANRKEKWKHSFSFPSFYENKSNNNFICALNESNYNFPSSENKFSTQSNVKTNEDINQVLSSQIRFRAIWILMWPHEYLFTSLFLCRFDDLFLALRMCAQKKKQQKIAHFHLCHFCRARRVKRVSRSALVMADNRMWRMLDCHAITINLVSFHGVTSKRRLRLWYIFLYRRDAFFEWQ